jgi:hypothetical protein
MQGGIMSKRLLAATAATVAAVAMTAVVGSGAASTAKSAAFEGCNISGKQKKLGASYVTSLKVEGVSCAKGEKVIKAYHQCRKQNGPAGRCGGSVLGFSCKDGKRQTVPDVQYNATAKCRKNSNDNKRVKSSYTQNI